MSDKRKRRRERIKRRGSKPPLRSKEERKPLNKIIKFLLGVIAAIPVIVPAYAYFQTPITATVQESKDNIFNADFIFKNEGWLTLQDTIVDMDFCVKYPTDIKYTPAKGALGYLGDIKRGQTRVARAPLDLEKLHLVKGFAICTIVKYKALYILKKEERFGFFIDQEQGINHWINVPCGEPEMVKMESGEEIEFRCPKFTLR